MLLMMTAGLSGPDFNLAPGDKREFDSDEAERLKAAGFAVDAVPDDRAPKAKKGKADVVSAESDGSADGGADNA
jgi:hypothetical protein